MLDNRQTNRMGIALLMKSARLGAKTGLILSSLYTGGVWLLIAAKLIVEPLIQKEIPYPGELTTETILGGGCFIIVMGSLLGIVPSILVGALTAIFISAVLWFGKAHLSTPLALAIGIGVAFFVAKLIEIELWPKVPDPSIGSFLDLAYYLWRVPVYVYIISSGWLGWRLWQFVGGNAGIHSTSSGSIGG